MELVAKVSTRAVTVAWAIERYRAAFAPGEARRVEIVDIGESETVFGGEVHAVMGVIGNLADAGEDGLLSVAPS